MDTSSAYFLSQLGQYFIGNKISPPNERRTFQRPIRNSGSARTQPTYRLHMILPWQKLVHLVDLVGILTPPFDDLHQLDVASLFLAAYNVDQLLVVSAWSTPFLNPLQVFYLLQIGEEPGLLRHLTKCSRW